MAGERGGEKGGGMGVGRVGAVGRGVTCCLAGVESWEAGALQGLLGTLCLSRRPWRWRSASAVWVVLRASRLRALPRRSRDEQEKPPLAALSLKRRAPRPRSASVWYSRGNSTSPAEIM